MHLPPATLAQLFWNPALPVAAVLAAALLFVAAAIWAWRGLAARFGARRAWPILAARGALFTLLLLALLDPVWRQSVAGQEPRRVVVLTDASASMDVRDAPGGTARAERARQFVARARDALPRATRVEERRFDAALWPAEATAAAARGPSEEPPGTDIGAALSETAARLETPDTAAVLLLTDGGDETVEPVRMPAAPLLILGVGGDGRPWPNLAVAQVEAPDAVEKESTFTIAADITATGPPALRAGQEAAAVDLLRRDGASWRPVERRTADLRNGRGRVTFTASCAEPGAADFRVAVAPAAGEWSALDNRRTLGVDVRRKTLGVLYFSRRLGADLKMLRQELGGDPAVSFCALYRSTGERYTVQMPPPGAAAMGEEELRRGFPGDAERLRRFDCLLLGSFPAHEWAAAEMRAVLQFVEQGGGLILLGGDDSFDGGGYFDSPLQPLLPWRGAGGGSSLQRGTFTVSVPAAAEQDPAVAGLRDALGGGDGATAVLTVTSLNVPGDPVAGAQTLLEAAGGGRKAPLVLSHRYGRGRILTVASNTTWLWAREPGAAAAFYRRFWRQAVRAACGQTEGGRVLQVVWSKPVYRPGESAVATVRAPGVTDARLRAVLDGASGSRPLPVTAGEDGAWRVEWPVEARGVWNVQMTAERGGETLETYRRVLSVAPLPDEGSRLARPDAELDRLAARGHGVYAREQDAGALLDRLAACVQPAARIVPRSVVSDGPWFALAAVLAAVAELVARRRLNLL
jgi:uncharacterized membrane protein